MYALLNEIWSDFEQPPYKNVENIMDIYLTEPNQVCQEESKQDDFTFPVSQEESIQAYDQFSLLKNACTIDSIYEDETNFVKSIQKPVVQIETEEEALSKNQIYRNLVEKFAQERQQLKNQIQNKKEDQAPPNYLELGIYILSGIILIFFMEQILKLGKSLKV